MGERLAVGIIGAGRAGSALGLALAAADHHVDAVYAPSEAGWNRAAAAFPLARRAGNPGEAARNVDVVLIGVPDDRVASVAVEVAAGLVAAGHVAAGHVADGADSRRPAPLVAHLSGRHGLAPLAPLVEVGAHLAAMHPIMTLTGAMNDVRQLRGCTFGVTTDPGDPVAADLAQRLVADVGARAAVIPDDRRAEYHAALVLGGNFLATLVTTAASLLADVGVPEPATALAPLLRASLDNALAEGEVAMTGPVRRGDVGTLVAQRDELRRFDPAVATAFAALGTLTAERLRDSGLLARAAAEAVRSALSDATPRR